MVETFELDGEVYIRRGEGKIKVRGQRRVKFEERRK